MQVDVRLQSDFSDGPPNAVVVKRRTKKTRPSSGPQRKTKDEIRAAGPSKSVSLCSNKGIDYARRCFCEAWKGFFMAVPDAGTTPSKQRQAAVQLKARVQSSEMVVDDNPSRLCNGKDITYAIGE